MQPERLAVYQQRVEQHLQQHLNSRTVTDQRLLSAMSYSLLLGGKRVRPFLVYSCGTLLGASLSDLDGPAAALEALHSYSLIHDDLPAMDNDSIRRGKPTLHIAFDEATAILAGDALQTQAYLALALAKLRYAKVVPSGLGIGVVVEVVLKERKGLVVAVGHVKIDGQ